MLQLQSTLIAKHLKTGLPAQSNTRDMKPQEEPVVSGVEEKPSSEESAKREFKIGKWLATPPPGEEVVISGNSQTSYDCETLLLPLFRSCWLLSSI